MLLDACKSMSRVRIRITKVVIEMVALLTITGLNYVNDIASTLVMQYSSGRVLGSYSCESTIYLSLFLYLEYEY